MLHFLPQLMDLCDQIREQREQDEKLKMGTMQRTEQTIAECRREMAAELHRKPN